MSKYEAPAPMPSSAAYAAVVQGGLSIMPIPETRLVYVSYVSPNAGLAADIVNALAEEFVNFSVETRYEATKQTSEFLTEQIALLRDELKRKEEDLQKYGTEKNLLYLSDNESTVVSNFADVNTALTNAQIERYAKEAAYLELKGLNVDSLPESVSNPTIQALRTTYTQVRSDYDEKSRIYRPEYPEMIQLKARLDATRNTLLEEIRKAVDARLESINDSMSIYRPGSEINRSEERGVPPEPPQRAARRRHPDEQERHLLPHAEDRGGEPADTPQHAGR